LWLSRKFTADWLFVQLIGRRLSPDDRTRFLPGPLTAGVVDAFGEDAA
jgi:hypothetical protein